MITILNAYPAEPHGVDDPLILRVEFSNGAVQDILLRSPDEPERLAEVEKFERLLLATRIEVISDTRELIGREVQSHYFN